MNTQKIAEQILDNIGGQKNIKVLGHCSTRLRLTLHDGSYFNGHNIEEIEGVKGQFLASGQYQIIFGTGIVNKVYAALSGQNTTENADALKASAYSNLSVIQKISRILGDVFVPIIPVLVATGLFMGILSALKNTGVELDDNFLLLATILTRTAFAFLPALVAWSAMRIFGGTPVIGLVLGLMLVAPQLPNASQVAAGLIDPINISIFGFVIPVVSYQGSVLPALVMGIFAAKFQLFLKRIIPDVLDLIVTPFLTLLVSMVLGLLIVGPIVQEVELIILHAVKAFMSLPFGLGGLIIGGTQQLIVVTGMHHIFLALETELLSSTGFNPFNAMIAGGIIAQGSAALAVALKTKNKKKRMLYFSSALPAFLGITEPAIFGVNLRFVKPFIFALTGGAVSGMFGAAMHMAGTGLGTSALTGMIFYLYSSSAFIEYLILLSIAFTVSFSLTYLFVKNDEIEKI